MDMYQDRPSWKSPLKRVKHNRMLDKRAAFREKGYDPDIAVIKRGGISEGIRLKTIEFFEILGE